MKSRAVLKNRGRNREENRENRGLGGIISVIFGLIEMLGGMDENRCIFFLSLLGL